MAGRAARAGGATLYTKEQPGHVELCLGMEEEPIGSLWVTVRVRERMGKGAGYGGCLLKAA